MELSAACAAAIAENFVFHLYEGDTFHDHSVQI